MFLSNMTFIPHNCPDANCHGVDTQDSAMLADNIVTILPQLKSERENKKCKLNNKLTCGKSYRYGISPWRGIREFLTYNPDGFKLLQVQVSRCMKHFIPFIKYILTQSQKYKFHFDNICVSSFFSALDVWFMKVCDLPDKKKISILTEVIEQKKLVLSFSDIHKPYGELLGV